MRPLLAAALCAALAACQGGGTQAPTRAAPAGAAGGSPMPAQFITGVIRLAAAASPYRPEIPPPDPPGVATAEAHPLGSKANPVRVCGRNGQRACLSRLHRRDGAPPDYDRAGSGGEGPHGGLTDRYELRCGKTRRNVCMDTVRPRREDRPIPGFSIAPAPRPARPASGPPAPPQSRHVRAPLLTPGAGRLSSGLSGAPFAAPHQGARRPCTPSKSATT